MQVVASPGANVVSGHETGSTFGSLTATFVSVTVPVLVTTKLNAIVSPASSCPLPLASTGAVPDLSSVNAGTGGTGVSTLPVPGGGSVTPGGDVAVAVAVLPTARR